MSQMKGEFQDSLFPNQQHQHLLLPKESQTSEEEDGSKNSEKTTKKTHKRQAIDGATIEISRRPRGRPPGSKNKPKPPIIITRDPDSSSIRPHVLEIPIGIDIIDSISRFAHRRNIGLCLLSGTGTVANVTLQQPSSATPASTVTFHGRFEILSISATFLPPATLSSFSVGFKISLAGAQGQVVGGSVVGPLVAAGTVVVLAAVFSSATYHRLPVDDEISGHVSAGTDTVTQPMVESIYNCHLNSDVIWAPTPRQPLQPPPF
ncbi:AT-hook motif nuclear-localized protein 28-like [Tasmannia lanceolata]|uniref:AT-hook motif nuclear-localized protein 28-like n=1 Tax=Tasmannia lanceolata TaxID=3420 RepID=UPI0040641328